MDQIQTYYVNKSAEFVPTAITTFLLATASASGSSTTTEFEDESQVQCTPYKWTNSTSQACEYVKQFSDVCEGGGYFLWTEYVVCTESDGIRYLLLTVAVIVLLYLFLAMSSAADDFFCPSISTIVDHLKISQSVAGITFMAFGNGAPDIFSTIASVLNTKHPKAGLAIGELLGGGAYVTTVVFSTVIMVKPFKIARKPTIRDISFYLLAIGWMAFIMFYDSKLYSTGHTISLYLQCRHRDQFRMEIFYHSQENPSHLCTELIPIRSHSVRSRLSFDSPVSIVMEPTPTLQRNPNFVIPTIVITPANNNENHIINSKYQNGVSIHKEKGSDYGIFNTIIHSPSDLDSDDSDPAMIVVAPPLRRRSGRRFTIMSASDVRRADLWCKPLSIAYTFTMPITTLVTFGILGITPISGGPGLWAYFLPLSFISAILLVVFTSYNKEPKYYKHVAAYLGFLMSVSWIYAISSEIVNIISMISVISRLSPEILGLTVMAWSNSIGDLVADVSVAKQGFPQMAASAAIGGPLFNLLVGFGASFFIATITGKDVDLSIDTVKALLLILLAISLMSTQIIFAVNKFFAKRIHGYILITLYVTFLFCLILTELKVINI
ncbi:hypothetical protein FO519_009218 [Halicephalobus sp. NKZ332]|nr:hypothetical protein FO519_009218 [Halicephalobus sp. NKZ332]